MRTLFDRIIQGTKCRVIFYIILLFVLIVCDYDLKVFNESLRGFCSNGKRAARCIILKGDTALISFTCIKCGHAYSVPDEYAGKKVRCKQCQTVNTIPSAPAPAGASSPACADSIAAYNNLLNELLRYEKQAPTT